MFLLFLSGCTDGATSNEAGGASFSGSSAPEFDESTGAIQGIVTDDSLNPLSGVELLISETGATAVSVHDGSFAFSRLPPEKVHLLAQKIGFESIQRAVEILPGEIVQVSLVLPALAVAEPFTVTKIQDGLIGCGVLGRTNNDPNASHNIVALCGIFGNAGYYNIDKFHLVWRMGDLEDTSGAWGEVTWTPSQAAGRSLGVIWTLWDSSNTAGGVYTFARTNGRSPLSVRIPSELLIDLLSKRTTIQDCSAANCTVHTYHYGRADTLGPGFPVDVGFSLQQRYTEYYTLFYNQPLPERFTALPDR